MTLEKDLLPLLMSVIWIRVLVRFLIQIASYQRQGCQVGIFNATFQKFGLSKMIWDVAYVSFWHFLKTCLL